MKTKILILILLLGCNVTLLAHLGDTPAQIEKVLGKPYRNAWDVQRWYEKKPYRVYIQFENVGGTLVDVLEVWSRADGRDIPESERNKIIDRSYWSPHSAVNPVVIKYHPEDHVLFITTKRWLLPKGESVYTGS